MKANIFEIKRFAVHDGDGIRTTVFLKGCPLKCVWCHNPEGISFKSELAYYENKCIGCGECLMHADFCAELLKKLKEKGVHTAVDTCGLVSKETLDTVIPYTDIFLYDIKAIDEDVHKNCTAQSSKQILENIKYLDDKGCQIEVRIPYVPKYNDGEIVEIAQLLLKLKNLTKVRVLPYHNYAGSKYVSLGMENKLPSTLPTEEQLENARKEIEGYGIKVM